MNNRKARMLLNVPTKRPGGILAIRISNRRRAIVWNNGTVIGEQSFKRSARHNRWKNHSHHVEAVKGNAGEGSNE